MFTDKCFGNVVRAAEAEKGATEQTEGKTADNTETKAETKTETKTEQKLSWKDLIAQFDEEDEEKEEKSARQATKQTKQDDKPKIQMPEGWQDLVSFAKDAMVTKARNDLVDGLIEANSELKGVSKDLLMPIAVGMVALNGDLEKAFTEREQYPRRWNTIAKAVAAQLSEQFGAFEKKNKKTDQDDDKDAGDGGNADAARAAARTAEIRKPRDAARQQEDAKVTGMSNNERLAYWRKQGINLGL